MPEITWDMIIDNLKETDTHLNRFEVGTCGEILCKTEEDAECIADFLEAVLNMDDICTSENDDFDGFDGWKWDVHLNGM